MYKTDKQQGLTGNYIQCLVVTYSGKESEQKQTNYIYIYMNESFCYTPEINVL